jgi:hypothetical protein
MGRRDQHDYIQPQIIKNRQERKNRMKKKREEEFTQ